MNKILLPFAILLAALASAPASAATRDVTTAAVHMRRAPSVHSAIITTIPRGASVIVFACPRRWCSVQWRGYRGWVSARYLAGTAMPLRRAYPPIYSYPPGIILEFDVFPPGYYYPRYERPRIYRPYRPRVHRPRVHRPRVHRPRIQKRRVYRPRVRPRRVARPRVVKRRVCPPGGCKPRRPRRR
jgi:uncharacterized protein YraI